MSISETFTTSISSTNSSIPLTGYETETGNTEIVFSQSFPANSNAVSITGFTFNSNAVQAFFFSATQPCTIYTNGGNAADVQTILVNGGPTGGDIAVSFNGSVTSLPYNCNAATAQTQLQGMASIGNGNITCTGGPLNSASIVCTFNGTMNAGYRPLMTVYNNTTGGTNTTATVQHTTSGLPNTTLNLQGQIAISWGTSAGYFAYPFNGNCNSATLSCNAATVLTGKVLIS